MVKRSHTLAHVVASQPGYLSPRASTRTGSVSAQLYQPSDPGGATRHPNRGRRSAVTQSANSGLVADWRWSYWVVKMSEAYRAVRSTEGAYCRVSHRVGMILSGGRSTPLRQMPIYKHASNGHRYAWRRARGDAKPHLGAASRWNDRAHPQRGLFLSQASRDHWHDECTVRVPPFLTVRSDEDGGRQGRKKSKEKRASAVSEPPDVRTDSFGLDGGTLL